MRHLFFSTRHMKTFLFFLISAFLGAYIYCIMVQKSTIHTLDPSIEAPDFRREIAAELEEVTRYLITMAESVDPHVLIRLNSIISRLDPRHALSDQDMLNTTKESDEMCAEEYTSNRGWPFYQDNFHESPSCNKDEKSALDMLVTVLLDFTQVSSENVYESDLNNTLKGVWEYDVGVKVLLGLRKDAENSKSVKKLLDTYPNVEPVYVASSDLGRPGVVWNNIASLSATPYVLVGRDIIHFSSYALLERQIYIISTSDNVLVAGGSFRNRTGHWRAGCIQSELKNYRLKYVEGYKYSARDCMLCDSLHGPFVTKTELLKTVPFNEVLSEQVVFENWFLHIKHLGKLVMGCPDVMYFTQGDRASAEQIEDTETHATWLSLAKEWEVHDITLHTGKVLSFSCDEIGLSCDAFKLTKSYLLPGCCLSEIHRVFKALHDFSQNFSVQYELDAGSLLGAVKINGFMPWDIDGDMIFCAKDYLTFYKNRKWFLEQGISMDSFSLTYNGKLGFFKLYAYQIFIEMYGANKLSSFLLPDSMQNIPTLVNVLGTWMVGQANPGLYSRNRYGPNYLKHSHSWRFLDVEHGSLTYKAAGTWRKCPNRFYHACLNHFPSDGNLDFFPP